MKGRPDGIIIKNQRQIDGIRKASRLAARILDELGKSLEIGMETKAIDELCLKLTTDAGAVCAPKNYRGFPAHVCVSPNNVICHGIPGDYKIKDGDIINIDVTPILNNYYGDTNRTFLIGNVDEKVQKLVSETYTSMHKGIKQIKPGSHLSNIGFSIEKHAKKFGYGVVKDFCGHGVGIEFHEEPQVLHYGKKNRGVKLEAGMIFTVEPMINLGDYRASIDPVDGWTARTVDGSLSAQFEHTILVTNTGYEILTTCFDSEGKEIYS